jgi:RHS repeat-associated protein
LTNPFQYTARGFDAETNLQFSRARYYDSTAGRFLTEDPLRWGGGLNLYLYVKNQPVTLNDPEGLAPSSNSELNCLTCIVYSEGGGLNAPCQYGIASAVLNRLGAARRKGKRASICSIVAAPGQFNGYNNPNYKGCMKCSVAPNRQPDLDHTVANFRVPFPVSDDIYFFGNNTRAIRNYFGKKLGLKPVDVPNCPNLAFYGEAGEE